VLLLVVMFGPMRTPNSKQVERQRELRERRVRAGWTIDEAGRRSGLERSKISRAERGYIALTEAEIERLEAVLCGVTP
jgi:transcriptional regulator with XRE-family HTH domain